MFAVIRTGGKQYRVQPDDVIRVEKLAAETGASFDFDQVLMVGEGATATAGTPLVAGARVTAEVLEQAKSDKIIVFKKHRRKGYRRRHGHRQEVTVLRVTGITGVDGKTVKAKAKPESKAKAKPEADVEAAETKADAAGKPAPEAKKAAPKKAAAKTAAPKKAAPKKAAPKKTAPKKAATAKKAPAKKAAAKKPAAKGKSGAGKEKK